MTSFLTINGYAVPVSINASSEVDYQEVGGEVVRAYAGNLLSSVKAHARVWRVVTVPMPNQMGLGLASTLEQPYPLACDGVFVGGPVTCRARGVRTMAVATAYGPHRVVEFELHEEAPAKSPWSILFGYQGGNLISRPAMHFSRSSPALYRDRSGVWQEAAPGVPRTSWGTDPVTGLLVPRYLTEPGGTNLMEYSEPTVAQLSTSGGSADAGPSHGFANWLHLPAPVDATVFAYGRASLDEGVTYTVSIFVRTHDSAPPTNRFTFRRRDGANIGSPTELREEAPGVYRCSRTFVAPAAQTATHLGISRLPGQGDGPIWATGIQIESTGYLSSYIRTTGAPTTRARDTLYVDLPDEVARPGAPLAIYARTLVGASGHDISGGTSLWALTNHGGAAPRLSLNLHSATGTAQLFHGNGESFTNAATSLIPAAGDLLESLTLIWAEIIDGRRMLVGRLIARVLPAGSSQWGPIESADLPPLEPAPEWSAPRLYVGSRGSAPGVYEYEALKLYAGRLSGSDEEVMAFMAAFGGV